MCRELRVIWCAMVRLMAGLFSSRMILGDVWGKPRSVANWRKKVTSLAHLSSVGYSALQGLRATPDVSAEEWTTNGVLAVPIWMVYAEYECPSGWHAWDESAAAKILTSDGKEDGLAEKVGPR